MEDIREAALAYYANSSDETKKLANSFFKTIDADGNGFITLIEFQAFAKKIWSSGYKLKLFALFVELDKNGDGRLDYEEFIVMFYMLTISYWCDGCQKPLNNRYFTCVQCFQNYSDQTYDICLTCYKTKQFPPGHTFIDNYAMFQRMRKTLMIEVAQPANDTTESFVEGSRRNDWNGVGQTVFTQASQQAISYPDQVAQPTKDTRGNDKNSVGLMVVEQASQQALSDPDQVSDAVEEIVGEVVLLLSAAACSIM